MVKTLPVPLWSLVLLLCLASAGCEQLPNGPSLSNVALTGFSKLATTDNQDSSLCCCRAVANATNKNSVPIYLSITLSAVDSRGSTMSKVLFFVPDVAPGQTVQVVAPGFPFPCNAIASFSPEVKVRGLTDPPL
jgi:hypothetical protein